MGWAGHAAHMGDKCVNNFGWKVRRKTALGRSGCRWEYNNKMDLREIGLDGVDWIQLGQNRERWWAVVNTVMNLLVP
jgi:hypothetical protein